MCCAYSLTPTDLDAPVLSGRGDFHPSQLQGGSHGGGGEGDLKHLLAAQRTNDDDKAVTEPELEESGIRGKISSNVVGAGGQAEMEEAAPESSAAAAADDDDATSNNSDDDRARSGIVVRLSKSVTKLVHKCTACALKA